MVWLMFVVMIAVVKAQSSTASSGKIEMLEKQVEILTNLVHAQSNIMSKFSCESGANSNPTSECILKIADQAKKISKLEGELKSLQTASTTQGNSILQLQATVSDLSAKLKAQGSKLSALDSKYSSEVSKLHSEIQNVDQKTKTLTNNVNQLGTKVQTLTGQWPSGSYCILASGTCPTGFSRRSGYMRAISLYAGSGSYINQVTFGDSKIQCHGSCGQYGHWTGELYIYACCK